MLPARRLVRAGVGTHLVANNVRNAADLAPILVAANRVRHPRDLELIRAALLDRELATVPEDPAIIEANRQGRSPVETAPASPGVRAIASLAARLSAAVATARHPAV